MDGNNYSFTPANLAIEGSLELFLELYKYTESIYKGLCADKLFSEGHRKLYNSRAIPLISNEFDFLAWRRNRIFSNKKIHITPDNFKLFDFFDKEKIKEFNEKCRMVSYFVDKGYILEADEKLYLDHLEGNNNELPVEKCKISFETFLSKFKLVVVDALYKTELVTNPTYTIDKAYRDIKQRICSRIKKARDKYIIPIKDGLNLTSEPLYLYDSLNNTKCKLEKHNVISKNYYAPSMDGKSIVVLPAHYCEDCNKYLFGAISFSYFQDVYGKLVVRKRSISSEGDLIWQIHGESKLHQLGYNVINGKLTPIERQAILVSILESKQLSFFEIVATIEQDIRNFSNHPKMRNAVEKWRQDLKYLNNYIIEK